MEYSKEKIVEKLYTMRSGLSLISNEKDNIRMIDESAENEKKSIKKQNFNGYYSYVIGTFDYENSYDEYSQHDEKNNKTQILLGGIEREKNSSQIKKRLNNSRICSDDIIRKTLVESLVIIGFIASIVSFILLCVFGFYPILIVSIIGMVAFGIIFFRIEKVCYLKKINKQIDEYIEKVDKVKLECADIEKGKLEKIEIINLKVKKIYKAICKYNDIISESDWQYIDLIIYYLQTGRADSIKEALQQLDKLNQTNAIINEIRVASDKISNTIKTSIEDLKEAVVRELQALSIMIGSLVSGQTLTNALLAKNASSSQQLVNDLEYIRRFG